MILLAVTAFIFLGYYFSLICSGGHKVRPYAPHEKIILAGIWSAGQIILTQLFLGAAGMLYLPILVFLNTAITLSVVLFARFLIKAPRVPWRQECQQILDGFRQTITPENTFLLVLLAFVLIWEIAAIYFIPPRGLDDRTYHLPVIYEYIINHKIFLLPVAFNNRFAFPENAELLFMWPAILLHSQQWVNSVQLVVALWGGMVVYGLARLMGIFPRVSLFISLLFLFTPVVLSQMGTCYIDIITAVFFLVTLYCAGMFNKSGRLLYFYSTALAAGLLWGMKYNEILMVLLIVPFFCVKKGLRPRHWIGFIIVFLMAGGFWYLRNFLVFNTPVYPPLFFQNGATIYSGPAEKVSAWGGLMSIPSKLMVLWEDPSLKQKGGLGLVFWGLAWPAWFYVGLRSIIQKKWFDCWMYFPFIIVIGQAMWLPVKFLIGHDFGRYYLFVVALGLLALGQVMISFEGFAFFRRSIKILGVLFSVMAVVQLSNQRAAFRIDVPVKAFINERYVTKVLMDTRRPSEWGVLDFLTADGRGLSCYIGMTDKRHVANAYAYGMKLQNKIWNLQQDQTRSPDAFLFYRNGRNFSTQDICAVDSPEEMMHDPNYLLVARSGRYILFIRKDFFKDPAKQQLLADYYRITVQKPPAHF